MILTHSINSIVSALKPFPFEHFFSCCLSKLFVHTGEGNALQIYCSSLTLGCMKSHIVVQYAWWLFCFLITVSPTTVSPDLLNLFIWCDVSFLLHGTCHLLLHFHCCAAFHCFSGFPFQCINILGAMYFSPFIHLSYSSFYFFDLQSVLILALRGLLVFLKKSGKLHLKMDNFARLGQNIFRSLTKIDFHQEVCPECFAIAWCVSFCSPNVAMVSLAQ